ncbi:hypothetical protein [Arthrobacter sp. H-02-3]|uniref:hypothetical protein n=1 Tax=Arthrobacter sp. H-02-3 TaxID=2703675 RepID=UPI001057B537|nr:hypothetical protein [Arthrobacter sp. H-02-3]
MFNLVCPAARRAGCSLRAAVLDAAPGNGIRRTLQIGAEHLTDKQAARLDAKLRAGDPGHEVTLA